MMRFTRFAALATACAAFPVSVWPIQTHAHGFVGDRFFPATLLTDDPFVADEMSLPTFTVNPKGPDESREIDLGTDISKTLWPDIGVTFSDQWEHLRPKGAPVATGLGTFGSELDWQFLKNAEHEATLMTGVNVSWAHTGRVQALGADDFTTVSPLLDFGKGFGDLPDSLPWLRPFAITGNFSVDFPTKVESAGTPNPNNFNYGFAFEYSLPYLEENVKDIGLTGVFKQLIPLVETSYSTALNRGQSGQTIGTVQPGIIWAGQYCQIGAEAIIPVTRQTGNGYGGLIQLHLYLDDIFPNSFGKPLFGSLP